MSTNMMKWQAASRFVLQESEATSATKPASETTVDRSAGKQPVAHFQSICDALLPAPIIHCGGAIEQHQAELHPEEAVYVQNSVKRRVREFTAGRTCARRALDRLGIEDTPIRMGARRQPLWPAGVVGSISHGAGYCIAAVCTRNHFASLGVDIEAATPLSSSLLNLVCTPLEREWCESQGSGFAGLLAKFHFSAKEAVFKCLYPVFGEELEFTDVHLQMALHEERFTAQVSGISLGADSDLVLRGRFACTADVVLTVVTLQDRDFDRLPFGFRFGNAIRPHMRAAFGN